MNGAARRSDAGGAQSSGGRVTVTVVVREYQGGRGGSHGVGAGEKHQSSHKLPENGQLQTKLCRVKTSLDLDSKCCSFYKR